MTGIVPYWITKLKALWELCWCNNGEGFVLSTKAKIISAATSKEAMENKMRLYAMLRTNLLSTGMSVEILETLSSMMFRRSIGENISKEETEEVHAFCADEVKRVIGEKFKKSGKEDKRYIG